VRTDHRGARRTAYSFRQFHISQQLIAGVDVFLLAKNTGTSSDMIERFYGQVRLERKANELRPAWRAAPGGQCLSLKSRPLRTRLRQRCRRSSCSTASRMGAS
jgi:hypothetical protein